MLDPTVEVGADRLLGGGVGAGWPVGEAAGKFTGRLVEALIGQHPINHPPALEHAGVVWHAGHDQLARPTATGSLGQPLGPAHRGSEADYGLDEPKLRRLRRQDQVARQRQLERPRQAEGMRGKHSRAREPIDSASELYQALEHRARRA